ncbi:MAG TPA: enoyl-CoA hydratase/isomerase family protein [Thermoleophilaceae bacterium]
MTTYRQWRETAAADTRSLVRMDHRGDRVTLTLSEPERLNPLGAGLNVQLQQRLEEIAWDPAIRSVVITGEDPAFSAGGDLEMMRNGNRAIRDPAHPADTTDPWRWIRRQFGGVVRIIASTDKLFVAAINGPAAGVGLAFALACDVVIASERAILVPAFGKLGLVPEVGTSWTLTRRLGYHGAMAYYLRGEQLDAHDALKLGLVGEVHAHEDLLAGADAWCDLAGRTPVHALEMAKTVLRAAADATWEEALRLEEFAEANCFSTEALGSATEALLSGSGRESPNSG